VLVKLRKTLLTLAAALLSLLLVIAGAEAVLRYYQYSKYGIELLSDANHGIISKDDRLGWKTSPNLHYRSRERDALNREYPVKVSTDGHGCRSFGNPLAARTKLLFLGDSFTAAVNVGDDKTYHGVLGSLLGDVEVFACGAGGYGSLQEFMLLDQYLDLIKPDAVLVQFYDNDFLDNDPSLDMIKSLYNTGTPRPYLEPSGAVASRYATYDGLFWTLPAHIADNLRLLKFLNNRLAIALSRLPKSRSATEEIARLGATHEGFRRSASTTQAIMAMIKKKAGGVPVYLFCITDRQPYYETIRSICEEVGLRFIEGVPQALGARERQQPLSTKAADREHLNEIGNRVVAESLLESLKADGAVRLPAR
jgi:hypothetical protein